MLDQLLSDNILFSDISQKRIYNLHDSLNDIKITQNLLISKNLNITLQKYVDTPT